MATAEELAVTRQDFDALDADCSGYIQGAVLLLIALQQPAGLTARIRCRARTTAHLPTGPTAHCRGDCDRAGTTRCGPRWADQF